MSTALGLAMQISANTAQLASAVQDVNKRLDDMAGAGKKAASDLGVLKNIEIARVFIDGIKLVADGLTTAASAAKRMFDDSRNAIDALGKLSESTGVAVETLQTFGAVADEAGVSNETFGKAISRLGIEVGKAEIGKDNAFTKLGLDVGKLKQQNIEATVIDVADAISKIGNDSERLAASSEVFGKIGPALLPLLNLGGDELKEAAALAERIGGVITADQVKQVEAMNDRFTQVGRAVQSIINQVTASLAPGLERVAQSLLDAFEATGGQNIGKGIADSLLNFVRVFVEAFRNIGNFLTDFITRLAELIGVQVGSDTEAAKELRAARALIDAGTAPQVGVGFATRLDPAFAARVEELEQIVATESAAAATSSIDRIADSILQGIDVAQAALAEPVQVNPAGADGITDSAVEGIDGVQGATEEQTEEIRGLRRDLRNNATQTVDILGAGT